MKIAKALIIFLIGIVVTISVAYFGFKSMNDHSVRTKMNLENTIKATTLVEVRSTIKEFGFHQLDNDRAETNVVYFKLKDDGNLFYSPPSLKSYYSSRKWFQNLKVGDSVQIFFENLREDDKDTHNIAIVEMFAKNEQVLYKDAYISNEVNQNTHWLGKTFLFYPNLIMLLIFVPVIFILWGCNILGLVRRPKLYKKSYNNKRRNFY